MTAFSVEGDMPILVEFAPRPGVQQASLADLLKRNREELVEKSAQALDGAMDAIRHMARRISALRDDIPVEFSQAAVQFGVKLD
jgi:hypothetical protein